MDQERSNHAELKNIQQIGTPDSEDRIYVEQKAYDRIYQWEEQERRVFILLGHMKCCNERYRTFVEAAIPVRNIEFMKNTPRWNNQIWNSVYQVVKETYSNTIIVGWALDQKGVTPRLNRELAEATREEFGAIHQVFFLLNTPEKEETFYVNLRKQIYRKEGFYIYSSGNPLQKKDPLLETSGLHSEKMENPSEAFENEKPRSMHYRDLLLAQEHHKTERKSEGFSAAAIAILVLGVVSVGAYQVRDRMSANDSSFPVWSTAAGLFSQNPDTETIEPTEGFLQETAASERKDPSQLESESITESESKMEPGTEKDAQKGDKPEGVPAGETGNKAEDKPAEETGDKPAKETAGQAAAIIVEEVPGIVPSKNSDAKQPGTNLEAYLVQEKDTLLSICRSRYQDDARVEEICRLNGITNPDDIRVGQVLHLPKT